MSLIRVLLKAILMPVALVLLIVTWPIGWLFNKKADYDLMEKFTPDEKKLIETAALVQKGQFVCDDQNSAIGIRHTADVIISQLEEYVRLVETTNFAQPFLDFIAVEIETVSPAAIETFELDRLYPASPLFKKYDF